MYARKASLCLKAESVSQFLQKVEHEVIPLFRKQRGFLDHLIIVPDRGNIVYVYTFWEEREDAEKYDRTTLPALSQLLTGVVDGALSVHAFGGLRGRLSGG
jgi:heme-degrading monooxygenase HmoA